MVALTEAGEAVIESYAYTSFGAVARTGGAVKNAFTFTGREYDEEIGLYFYRARYYDPEVGRFINKDPIGFAGGDANLYGYVGNDPVNWVDPFGLTREDIDRLLELVRQTQSGLNVPDKVYTLPFPGDGSAITNPITLNVTIDNYYLKKLNKQQTQQLFELLIHESIHRTRPRMDMIKRPFKHPDIYGEAARRRREIDKIMCY